MFLGLIPVAEASVVTLVQSINRVIINPLIIFIFALSLVYFLYGLAKYLLNPENEEVRSSSKQHMLWGVIGLFVMTAVFGILNIILGSLNSLGDTKIKIDNTGDYQVRDINVD